jgi:hypothetical protein
MEKETRNILNHICEKVTLLKSFQFEQHVNEIGLGVRIEVQPDSSYVAEFGLADDKDLHAFIQVFRFFYRGNEPGSIPNLLKISKDPALSDEWKNAAKDIQNRFNSFLEGYSEYTVQLFDGQPSRRKMFYAGLDGGLDHANNPAQVAQFQLWTRDGIRKFLFLQELTRIFLVILGLVYELGEISERELARG